MFDKSSVLVGLTFVRSICAAISKKHQFMSKFQRIIRLMANHIFLNSLIMCKKSV